MGESIKTIAIVMCLDTKEAEVWFIKEEIEKQGCKAFVIDTSTRGGYDFVPDISRNEVCIAGGNKPKDIVGKSKNVMVQAMMDGAKAIVPILYKQGKFDGIISAGGLQTTTMAVDAMKELPIGVPKLVVSTVACGQRKFEPFVGIKDIVLMPSIIDISGINTISQIILLNATSAIVGMVQRAGKPLVMDGKLRIGTTMMGATNGCAEQAKQMLEAKGYEVLSFHSTGVGGRCLENLINTGVIEACMDVSIHEIVSSEVFNIGFSNGARDRLRVACEKGIPMVVAPGGLDFIDVSLEDLQAGILGDPKKRKFNKHNNKIAHVKVFKDEGIKAAKIVVDRLNSAKGSVCVLLPLKGMRYDTLPGESLYDNEVDEAIFDVFRNNLREDIKLIEVNANLTDLAFSEVVATEMIKLINIS